MRGRSVGKPTNELNDLRTRGVETWSQRQKVRMSDEEAHRKKEAKKVKVEAWGQTRKVAEMEMSDEEACRKKEAEKEKEDRRKGRKLFSFSSKETLMLSSRRLTRTIMIHLKKLRVRKNLKELQKKLVKAIEDAEDSDESEASVEETDLTTPTSVSGKEKKREKKEAEKAKEDEERLETWSQTQKVKHQEGWSTDIRVG